MLRSLDSNLPVEHLLFKNTTVAPVQILWLDHNGDEASI